VEQKYNGPGRRQRLAELVAEYGQTPDFLIGGSGDVWSARGIFEFIEQTGVQLVSVARGCIGNPWIFTQARALMRGDVEAAERPPTIAQQRDVLMEHFELSVGLHGEGSASRMMRKFGIKFSTHHPDADAVKDAFIRVKSLSDWQTVLEHFYNVDGPGRVVSLEAVHTGESCAA